MHSSSTMPPPVRTKASARGWPARVGIAVAIFAVLIVGIAIGSAANSKTSQLNSDASKISSLRSQLAQEKSTVNSQQGQLTTNDQQMAADKSQAQHALSIATAQVKQDDAARQAQLNQESATLKSQQRTLNQEIGSVQANQISSSGVYVVGTNIKNGTWYTSGDGGQTGNQCYFATLSGDDTVNDIIDNNNFDGSETVNLSGVYALEISGPCTWVLQSS
jgi:hypothetical protein